MKVVTDYRFPKAATAGSSFDEALAAFKNERDYINQSGRMSTTVAAMDWANTALHSLSARVKELEEELYAVRNERDNLRDNLHEATTRALRAEQQRDEAYERAALACEKLQQDFLSEEYAIPQPAGSISERFACGRCAEKIRRLASGQGGSEVEK